MGTLNAGRRGGTAVVDYNVDNLVDVLWPIVQPIINDSSRNMMPFLRRLGVTSDEMSPFCRVFDTKDELLGAYMDYFSGSRVFANATSGEEVDESFGDDEQEDLGDDDEEVPVAVGNHGNMERMQEAIKAALTDGEG